MKHSFLLACCVCVRVCVAVFVWVCRDHFGRLPIVCMLSLDNHLCMNSCDSLFYGYLVFLNWYVCYKTKYCWVIASNQFSFRSFMTMFFVRCSLIYRLHRNAVWLFYPSFHWDVQLTTNAIHSSMAFYVTSCFKIIVCLCVCVCVQSLEMLQAYAFMPMLKI